MSTKVNPRTKLTISLTVISVILGLMLAMQYKQTRAAGDLQPTIPFVDPKANYTAKQLQAVNQETKQLESELEKLNKDLHELEKQAGSTIGRDSGLAPELRNELTKYRIMAGVLPVKGPGISFTIADSEVTDLTRPEDYIVHDDDLKMVVNELTLSGAEAIAINGERITSTTGIICLGPVTRVNGIRITPPYKFEAVGNVRNMTQAMEFQGGVFDVLTRPGKQLSVSKITNSPSVIIPGYSGDFNGLK
ncbi:MAG TPA: DUF881 domain-containing protein [Bacilli bacterium]|nr:DUF881 domain-containing protein [Bacilli bacterium]